MPKEVLQVLAAKSSEVPVLTSMTDSNRHSRALRQGAPCRPAGADPESPEHDEIAGRGTEGPGPEMNEAALRNLFKELKDCHVSPELSSSVANIDPRRVEKESPRDSLAFHSRR